MNLLSNLKCLREQVVCDSPADIATWCAHGNLYYFLGSATRLSTKYLFQTKTCIRVRFHRFQHPVSFQCVTMWADTCVIPLQEPTGPPNDQTSRITETTSTVKLIKEVKIPSPKKVDSPLHMYFWMGRHKRDPSSGANKIPGGSDESNDKDDIHVEVNN